MKYFLILFFSALSCCISAQDKDSSSLIIRENGNIVPVKTDSVAPEKDSVKTRKKHEIIPRKATIRSAILPGWGQIYNRSYWKLPLVYGALGTTAYVFTDNIKTYRLYRDAYRLLADTIPSNDVLVPDELKIYSAQSIKNGRDEFRRYIDYSVLFFLLFWGLNVVDATVDAHLKSFDVSEDLSFQIKPGYSPMANTTGISIVLNIGKNSSKSVISLR